MASIVNLATQNSLSLPQTSTIHQPKVKQWMVNDSRQRRASFPCSVARKAQFLKPRRLSRVSTSLAGSSRGDWGHQYFAADEQALRAPRLAHPGTRASEIADG